VQTPKIAAPLTAYVLNVNAIASATRSAASTDAAARVIAQKRRRLEALHDGWRGPGSLAPSNAARDFYGAVIKVLNPGFLLDAEPAPTPDGGIQMEWDRDEFSYTVEITREGNLVVDVFAADEADDVEFTITNPSPVVLTHIITRGVR
jgi:hypothetical protein